MDKGNKKMDDINEEQDLSQIFSIPDTFWEIEENKEDKIVDGINILARAKGPFFLVDGSSENGRYYSRELWEGVLEKSKKVLEEGMLGAVGHDQEINDKAIREGKLSHKVTKLYIDEDRKVKLKNGRVATIGMGEILVLNTDSGRNLNTYLRSGIKLATSSRARGRFKGKTEFGENVVDKDHYHFSTFDVVVNPGVPVSQLSVVESKQSNEDVKEDIINKNKGENNVDVKEIAEALEKVTTEKVKITSELSEALEKVTELMGKVNNLEESLKSKEALGSNDEIIKIKEDLDSYKEIGSCKSIREAYEKIESMMSKFEQYGDLDKIEETYSKFEDVIEELEDIGTISEIKKGVELLEEYAAFGSPENIRVAYEKITGYLDEKESEKAEVDAEELAEKHGIRSTGALKNVLEAIGKDDADILLSELEEGKEITSRYRHVSNDDIDEDTKPKSIRFKSSLERLFN